MNAMSYLRTILFPTDFFDCSRYAFRLARSLTIEQGARLVIVHVMPTRGPMVSSEAVLESLQPEQIQEKLREALQRCRVPGHKVCVERRLVSGDAAEQIVRLAREVGCDLIVMGTHGRTGLRRLLMGSVAADVLKNAPCPVVLVKTPRHAAATAVLAVGDSAAGEPTGRPGDLASCGKD